MGSKNRRRGSSTRKHKLPPETPKATQPTLPFQQPVSEATNPHTVTPSKQQKHYERIIKELRSGKNDKGISLTDEDITKKLNALGNLEIKLGITHKE